MAPLFLSLLIWYVGLQHILKAPMFPSELCSPRIALNSLSVVFSFMLALVLLEVMIRPTCMKIGSLYDARRKFWHLIIFIAYDVTKRHELVTSV